MWYGFFGSGLTGGDYYWLYTLPRNEKSGLPHGFKWWRWQFVRPEHAFLSKRGIVVFKDEWLPAGSEKKEITWRPLPYIDYDEKSSCVDKECSC